MSDPTDTIPAEDASYEDDDPPYCEVCGAELDWEDCNECGGSGYSYHDCGEDVCCCLDPEDNVKCDQCSGNGGWWECWNKQSTEHFEWDRRESKGE